MTTLNRYSSFELGDDCKCIATWGQTFWAVLANFVLRPHINSYLISFLSKNSDIAIRVNDPNFPINSNNLTIRRRSLAVTFTFDHLTLNIFSTSSAMWLSTKFERNRTICGRVFDNLSHFCHPIIRVGGIYLQRCRGRTVPNLGKT